MNWLQTISIVPQFCGYETVKIQTVKFLHENSPPPLCWLWSGVLVSASFQSSDFRFKNVATGWPEPHTLICRE